MKIFCASCIGIDVKSIIKTDNKQKSEWLKKTDYITNFIDSQKIKEYKQKKSKMNIVLNLGKENSGKYILYFGAKQSNKNNMLHIVNAKEAYNNFENSGISKIDKNGDVKLYFNCPQPYNEKNNKKSETFYRHIHFCYSNSDNTKWINNIYTKVIICNISLNDTLKLSKNNQAIILNALPCEYYAKSHIPNSYNLPVKSAKNMNKNEVHNWIKDIVELNYSKINDKINNNKINLYEVPIVVYCIHKNCDAAKNLAIELLKNGFVNLLYFKGGMKEYNKTKNKNRTRKNRTRKNRTRKKRY